MVSKDLIKKFKFLFSTELAFITRMAKLTSKICFEKQTACFGISVSVSFSHCLIHLPPPHTLSYLFHLEYQPVQVVPPFQMNRKIPLIHQLQEYREGQVSQETLLAQRTPFHLLKSKTFFIMSAVHTRRQRGHRKL